MTTAPGFVGNADQVDTGSDRNQVCCRSSARNEDKITYPGRSKRFPGSVRGSIENSDIGSTIPRSRQHGIQARCRRAGDDGGLRLPQITPLCSGGLRVQVRQHGSEPGPLSRHRQRNGQRGFPGTTLLRNEPYGLHQTIMLAHYNADVLVD